MQLFNNYEEVCAYLGIEPTEPTVTGVQPQHQKAIIATAKLYNVFEAHNKANDFKPDYTEGNYNRKYFPWLEVEANEDKPSGFGFSYTSYANWITSTLVGSRLECGTSDEAIHIGKTFADLYKDAFLLE